MDESSVFDIYILIARMYPTLFFFSMVFDWVKVYENLLSIDFPTHRFLPYKSHFINPSVTLVPIVSSCDSL